MTPTAIDVGDSSLLRIEVVDQRELAVARQMHAVLLLAHAQEARQLGVQNFVPMARTAEDLQGSANFHLAAFHGDELVGAVILGADDEGDQISVVTLVVHPSHQRRGIARRLMCEALHRGAGQVFSVCTAAANAPALALYRGLGFVVYRHGTLGPDALALVKLRRPPGAAPQ